MQSANGDLPGAPELVHPGAGPASDFPIDIEQQPASISAFPDLAPALPDLTRTAPEEPTIYSSGELPGHSSDAVPASQAEADQHQEPRPPSLAMPSGSSDAPTPAPGPKPVTISTKSPAPGVLSFTPQAILLDPAAPSPRGYAQVLTSALPVSPVPTPAAWGANGPAGVATSLEPSPAPKSVSLTEKLLASPRVKGTSSNIKKENASSGLAHQAAATGGNTTPRQDAESKSSNKRKARDGLREGDVVWARIAPYPYWPSRVESEMIEEVSAEEYAEETKKGNPLVVFFGSEQSEDVEFSFIPWEELVPWQKGLELLYQFLPDEPQEVQDDVARSYNEAIRWISLSNQQTLGGGGSTRGTPRAHPSVKRPKKALPEGVCARPICGAPGTRGPCKQPYGSCPYHKLGDQGAVTSPTKNRPSAVPATPEVRQNGHAVEKELCGVISTRGVPCKQIRSVCPYHRKDKMKHPKPAPVDRESTTGAMYEYQRAKASTSNLDLFQQITYEDDHDAGLKRKSVMEQQVAILQADLGPYWQKGASLNYLDAVPRKVVRQTSTSTVGADSPVHDIGAHGRPICGASGLRGPCKQPANSCPYHQTNMAGRHVKREKKMPDRFQDLVQWLQLLENSIQQLWQHGQLPGAAPESVETFIAQLKTTLTEWGSFRHRQRSDRVSEALVCLMEMDLLSGHCTVAQDLCEGERATQSGQVSEMDLLSLLRASQSAATVARQQRSVGSLITRQHELVAELRQEARTAEELKNVTTISYNADVSKLHTDLKSEEINLRTLKEQRTALQAQLRDVEARISTSSDSVRKIGNELGRLEREQRRVMLTNAHEATESGLLHTRAKHEVTVLAELKSYLRGASRPLNKRCSRVLMAGVSTRLVSLEQEQEAAFEMADKAARSEADQTPSSVPLKFAKCAKSSARQDASHRLRHVCGLAATNLELVKLIKSCVGDQLATAEREVLDVAPSKCRTIRDKCFARLQGTKGAWLATPKRVGSSGAETVVIWHEACFNHAVPEDHPEQPARLSVTIEVLKRLAAGAGAGKVVIDGDPPEIDFKLLQLVHHPRYLSALEGAFNISPDESEDGLTPFRSDVDTYVNLQSKRAVLLAAGSVMHAIDTVMSGQVRNAFCCVRPPGHHVGRAGAALGAESQGFCLLNNVCVGAAHARTKYPEIKKIVVVDFDVHHGNGTEDILHDDPEALFLSIHRHGDDFFPQSGESGNNGSAFNIALEEGYNGKHFRKTFIEIILPKIVEFNPDMLFISAGFDSHYQDPIGGAALHESEFGWATLQLMKLADQMCNGRVISALEGGYAATSLEAGLAVSVQSHVTALCGLSTMEDFTEIKIVENVRVVQPELYQGLPTMSQCYCCVGNKRAFKAFSQLKQNDVDDDIDPAFLCQEMPQ